MFWIFCIDGIFIVLLFNGDIGWIIGRGGKGAIFGIGQLFDLLLIVVFGGIVIGFDGHNGKSGMIKLEHNGGSE